MHLGVVLQARQAAHARFVQEALGMTENIFTPREAALQPEVCL